MTRRILLVDDELAILLTLKAILEMSGFNVETATSAREAKQKLAAGTYEMVITDMRMENETSGFEVIRAARSQAYNPATAILTAYPNLGGDWKTQGAESLLVTHQDSKQESARAGAMKQARHGHNGGVAAKESAPKIG